MFSLIGVMIVVIMLFNFVFAQIRLSIISLYVSFRMLVVLALLIVIAFVAVPWNANDALRELFITAPHR